MAREVEPRRRRRASSRFVFPGGFLGHRKPLEPVLEAFAATERPAPAAAGQGAGRAQAGAAGRARRPSATRGSSCGSTTSRPREHLRELASCDVCLAPARWEGLGLPLYEAIAFGHAGDHQRRPADERGDPRRRQRAAGRLAPRTARRSPGSRRSTPTSTSCGAAIERLADDALRAELAAGARARARRASGAWERDACGASANCWKRPRPGSLSGFMGLSDQIEQVPQAGRDRARRAAPARAHARAGAGAVRLRRDPLGHDAAAADARLAPRGRDPRRDALGAEADQGLRALASRPPTTPPT